MLLKHRFEKKLHGLMQRDIDLYGGGFGRRIHYIEDETGYFFLCDPGSVALQTVLVEREHH